MRKLAAQLNSLSARSPYMRIGVITALTDVNTGGSLHSVYASVQLQCGTTINNVVVGSPSATSSKIAVGTPVSILRVGPSSIALPLVAAPAGTGIWACGYQGSGAGNYQALYGYSAAGVQTAKYSAFGSAFVQSYPFNLCLGPDQNIWVVVIDDTSGLWRVTPEGVTTLAIVNDDVSAFGDPWAICTGPDGNLWIADENRIWAVDPTLIDVTGPGEYGNYQGYTTATRYELEPAEGESYAACFAICSGPDGNLWAADVNGYVWKITTSGVATPYALAGADPVSICSANGNLWAADQNGNVWKITTAGVPTSYALSGSQPNGICATPSGNDVWVADLNGAVWDVTSLGAGTKHELGSSEPYAI